MLLCTKRLCCYRWPMNTPGNHIQWSRTTLTKEQLAAIGTVAVESTYCEQWVEDLIWAFLDVEEDQGRWITHNMQMNARLELLHNLASPRLSHPSREEFADLIARLKTANQQRNLIIHGDWKPREINLLRALLEMTPREPALATKKKPKGTAAIISADDIESVAQAISNLTGELVTFARRSAHLWKN